jgi:hypothetical protein
MRFEDPAWAGKWPSAEMSGLRFVICLSLASIACLAYAGTAAALDGTTPVVAGVTAQTTGVVASTSVQAGSAQLTATVAVSSDARSEPGQPSPAPASTSARADVTVGAADTRASVGARVSGTTVSSAAVSVSANSRSVALRTTSGTPIRPVGKDDAKSRVRNRVVRHARRPATPIGGDAQALRPSTHPLRLRVEKPAVVPARRRVDRVVLISDGSRLPGSAGAGLGGGSGLVVSAILFAFIFLAASWCGRRLRPTAELARPPALLSALERPG